MTEQSIAIPPTFKVSYQQFQQLAAANRELQLETTARGELIVNPPTGGTTGNRNFGLEG